MTEIGSKIGPYEITGELGRGCMAVVWRGYDPNLEREVAVKEPLVDGDLPDKMREDLGRRFVNEAKMAAKLNHPNIVGIHAADVYDGHPAIVMEKVEGITLADLLEKGPLAPDIALSILDQILDGLGYAHSKGIVHRDLKPDNIFISEEGAVKIGDFGIARIEGDTVTKATQAGAVLGTPGYLSPEQAKGAAVDSRSDLFTVGTIAFEMLTGGNPFGSGDATSLLYRIVHEPELSLTDVKGLPESFSQGITYALQKDPAKRPQTAAQLKSVLHGSSFVPSSIQAQQQMKKEKPEWFRFAVIVAVAVSLIFLLFLVSCPSGNGGAGSSSHVSGATSNSASDSQGGASGVAVKVPDISDLDEKDALSILKANGLTGEKAGDQRSSLVSLGHIIEQNPTAGTFAQKGDTVRYLVSSGEESKEVAVVSASASSTLPGDEYTPDYGPHMVLDHNVTTIWSEGADGAGTGEWIELKLSGSQTVTGMQVVNGFPKYNDTGTDLHTANSRPKEVRVDFSDGSSEKVLLLDKRGVSETYLFKSSHTTDFVRLTVLSVYPGEKWDDLCIAEISLF